MHGLKRYTLLMKTWKMNLEYICLFAFKLKVSLGMTFDSFVEHIMDALWAENDLEYYVVICLEIDGAVGHDIWFICEHIKHALWAANYQAHLNMILA